MEELASGPAALALMALAAVIIGYSKTALGGLGVVAVAIFATVLPAKESTAAILAILIVGDVIACWHYRHDPDWSLIRRLLPAVVPGLVLGTLFLRAVDDETLRRTIGGVLLVLLLLQLWVKWRSGDEPLDDAPAPGRRVGGGDRHGVRDDDRQRRRAGDDALPVGAGIDKRRFVGTNAWFFLIVNLGEGAVLDRRSA